VLDEVTVIEKCVARFETAKDPKPMPTQEQLERWAREEEGRRIKKKAKAIIKVEEDRKRELWWKKYREKQEREKQEREH
jgi:hypothetical protein